MAAIMSVAGFTEALQAAVQVRVVDDLTVPVISIPGLAVLKLFAWADRRMASSKDADDLLILLRHYADSGNLDRLYTNTFHILESCDYDVDAAGAYLLGLDTATITSDDTRSRMLILLKDADMRDRLILHMARSRVAQEDSLTYVSSLLNQFVNGLSSGHWS